MEHKKLALYKRNTVASLPIRRDRRSLPLALLHPRKLFFFVSLATHASTLATDFLIVTPRLENRVSHSKQSSKRNSNRYKTHLWRLRSTCGSGIFVFKPRPLRIDGHRCVQSAAIPPAAGGAEGGSELLQEADCAALGGTRRLLRGGKVPGIQSATGNRACASAGQIGMFTQRMRSGRRRGFLVARVRRGVAF